ncbi:Uncharacterized protein conserved in bacteria [Citrobacter freundii]|nr:Uncharacterized protein conserved in bacteria [Citrobacter freundii]
MFKKMVLSTVLFVVSNAACAGMAGPGDFKCGRDDAQKALTDYIKNEATSILQSDFITKGTFNYDKPLAVYQNRLNSIGVTVTNVSTSGKGIYGGMNCSATISIKTPENVLEFVSKEPDFFAYIAGGAGRVDFNNGVVTWDDVVYSVRITDDNKGFVFGEFVSYYSSRAMFNMAALSVNKEQIMHAISQEALYSERSSYTSADQELNAVWKGLPDPVRKIMKKEQLAWVNKKVSKCGHFSGDKSEEIDVQQQINYYQCQTKMTNERVKYLTGKDN